MRLLLEREAVSYCVANRFVPSEELLSCIERMRFCTENGNRDWDAYLQADIAFHASVMKAADNMYIWKCWKLIESQYKMAMYMMRSVYPRAFFGTSEEHMKIYEQLLVGNQEPWVQHLENLKRDVDRIVETL